MVNVLIFKGSERERKEMKNYMNLTTWIISASIFCRYLAPDYPINKHAHFSRSSRAISFN